MYSRSRMVEVTYQMVLSTLQTVGLLVGIFYYITIMRNAQKTRELTLESQELARKAQEHAAETRQAQLCMQIINQWLQPDIIESYNFFRNSKFSSFEEYNQYHSNPETAKLIQVLPMYLEGLGVLVKGGYLEIGIVAGYMGGVVKIAWEKIAPHVYEFREKYQSPRDLIEFEYLYDEIMKYGEQHPELGIIDTDMRDLNP